MGRGTSGTGGGSNSGGSGSNNGSNGGANTPTSVNNGVRNFDKGVSKEALIDTVENGSYESRTITHDARGRELSNPITSETLGIHVNGRVTDSDYPSNGDSLDASAVVSKRSDGTYNLYYPTPSGTGKDRTYKSESAAKSAGRTALKKFINNTYRSK